MKKRILGIAIILTLMIGVLGGCTSSNGIALTKALINNYNVKSAKSESTISLKIQPKGIDLSEEQLFIIDLLNNSSISLTGSQDVANNKAAIKYAVKADDITYSGDMFVDNEKIWIKMPLQQKYIKYDPVDLVPENQKEDVKRTQKQALEFQKRLYPIVRDFIIDYVSDYGYTFDNLENKGVSNVVTPEGTKEVTTYELKLDLEDLTDLLKYTGGTIDEKINDDTLKDLIEEIMTVMFETMPQFEEEMNLEDLLAEFDIAYDQFKLEYVSQNGKATVDAAIDTAMSTISQYCEIGEKGITISYGVDKNDNVVTSGLTIDLIFKNLGAVLGAAEAGSSVNVTLNIDSLIYGIDKTTVTIPKFSDNEIISIKEFVESNEYLKNSPYASLFGVEKERSRVILSIGETYAYSSELGGFELDAAPFIKNESTLVPVRFIGDAFGALISWNDIDRSVTYVDGDKVIVMVIGSKIAYVNGEEVELPTEPVIVNDRTMVPLRFVSEQFGADVTWTEEVQMILIEKRM